MIEREGGPSVRVMARFAPRVPIAGELVPVGIPVACLAVGSGFPHELPRASRPDEVRGMALRAGDRHMPPDQREFRRAVVRGGIGRR